MMLHTIQVGMAVFIIVTSAKVVKPDSDHVARLTIQKCTWLFCMLIQSGNHTVYIAVLKNY